MLERFRALVVEDEYMLALDLRNQLEDVGAEIIGPGPSVERALNRVGIEPRIDAAILDVNLGGEDVFAVADALARRRVPLLFTTGYESDMVRSRFPDAVTCDTPYECLRLVSVLKKLGGP